MDGRRKSQPKKRKVEVIPQVEPPKSFDEVIPGLQDSNLKIDVTEKDEAGVRKNRQFYTVWTVLTKLTSAGLTLNTTVLGTDDYARIEDRGVIILEVVNKQLKLSFSEIKWFVTQVQHLNFDMKSDHYEIYRNKAPLGARRCRVLALKTTMKTLKMFMFIIEDDNNAEMICFPSDALEPLMKHLQLLDALIEISNRRIQKNTPHKDVVVSWFTHFLNRKCKGVSTSEDMLNCLKDLVGNMMESFKPISWFFKITHPIPGLNEKWFYEAIKRSLKKEMSSDYLMERSCHFLLSNQKDS